jgi:acetylglutamate kinase
MPGILRDRNDPLTLISSLNEAGCKELIASKVIDSGMIPKVEACLSTLGRGVGKVHIIDGQLRHSLLLEIYTTAGVGTEIVQHRNSPASKI